MNVQGSGFADALLRQTRVHHAQLSAMADVKASMLITMASVVLTLAVSHVMQPGPQWPLLVLMAFCIVTILLAAFAAMPKVHFRRRQPSVDERANASFNVLFFGDFNALSYQEFEDEMIPILSEPARNYESQVREIYSLGIYLVARKYRYLRWAYIAFMGGLLCTGSLLLFIGFH